MREDSKREDSKPEEAIIPDRDELLDLLKNIISFRTVAPPGDCYKEIVEWLQPIFKAMGFTPATIKIPEDAFAATCTD